MGDSLNNFFWFVLGGFIISALYFVGALVFIVTILGFRTGMSLLKLARYSLTPFGQKWKTLALVDIDFEETGGCSYFTRAILWFPFMVTIAAVHLVLTLVLCITVVGIPLARTHYTLIRFSAFPMIDNTKTRDACLFCD